MKIGLTINDHFANILKAVGQKNKVKIGGVCRLIVESQLTFYLQRGKIPTFFNNVGFTYDDKQEQLQLEESKSSDISSEDQESNEKKYSWEEEEERPATEDMTYQWLEQNE